MITKPKARRVKVMILSSPKNFTSEVGVFAAKGVIDGSIAGTGVGEGDSLFLSFVIGGNRFKVEGYVQRVSPTGNENGKRNPVNSASITEEADQYE
jgi:hypothetical protein